MGFPPKCSHFNLKLSVSHHCHIPSPSSPGHSYPLVGTGTSPWKGLLERPSTFTAFPELLLLFQSFHCICTTLLRYRLAVTQFCKGTVWFHTRHKFSSSSSGKKNLLLTENCSIRGHWRSVLLSKNHEVSKNTLESSQRPVSRYSTSAESKDWIWQQRWHKGIYCRSSPKNKHWKQVIANSHFPGTGTSSFVANPKKNS